MSNPGGRDIYSVGGNPYFGVDDIYGVPNANAPGVSWAPTGADVDAIVNSAANAMQGGAMPATVGKTELGTDFIQYTYLAPPWEDDTNKYIMPEMLAFSVNELDTECNSTTILSLPKVNQIMYQSHQDLKNVSNPNDPNRYENAVKFREFLEKYGEKMLEVYDYARRYPPLMASMEKDNAAQVKELGEFHRMAQQDVFCWCTRFGILRKMNYLGPVIGNSRAVSLEEVEDIDNHSHYTQINVGLAKRLYVANVFGPSDQVTTGSKLFLCLRRKKVEQAGRVSFEEYQVMPVGTLDDYVRQADKSYVDPSGRAMNGHHWVVGRVIVPGKKTPNPTSMTNAANVGVRCNERNAYESHGHLPTLTVAAGFK